jgi:hypothetical protein
MIKLKDIINEVKLQKGKTYGGTKCEGGCFVGKEGLKKIIKISKDSPKDVFMFRDDNYSGLQPHFVKDGVIAKATVLNPAYDLEKHKVRSLNIGKDVILSVRLFVSTNESVNEGLYHVGYNKGRGQGTGVFKDSYSSYKDAKKAVEKLEKERGGSYNMVAYYVSDKDGKFVKESELKGYLAADVVDDIVKSIGSKFVSGEIKNAPNRNYIYLKLTDIKFGNDVVKMLKSKFGIDSKIDKTFGNIPSVSFASKKVVSEAKSDYEVYHKSYTSAIEAAREYAEKKGYEINNDDAFTKIGMGPRKPSEGKTNKFSIELSKDGKVQRKKLQIQVYGMRNSYELNAYIQ